MGGLGLATLAGAGLTRVAGIRPADARTAGHGAGHTAAGSQPPADFTFAHVTDTHIQPELKAADGCRMCFEHVTRQEPDFAILGGDLVFDVNETARPRASMLFDLYESSVEALEVPKHHVVGNHDVFGIDTDSGVPPTDPLYGKKMYEDRIGERYYSFDHKGWRFIVLDSIAVHPAEERAYHGEIDPEQMRWLTDTLESAGPDTPIIVSTHIPILTAFWSILRGNEEPPPTSVVTANAKDVIDLLHPYNVKAVLQGHTHVREIIDYHGCKYITSGAVCGDWWKGVRLGHPEGYALITLKGGEVNWEYQTYGFKAVQEG